MSTHGVAPAVVVHGGAGEFEPDQHEAARVGCERAARIAMEILARGGAAVDAVQAAVRALEDDPTFNAGIGAALTRTGAVELDAAIMDGRRDWPARGDGRRDGPARREGRDRGPRVGAIAAMPNARQPIDIARAVMDDGEHVLLCGEGAWAFARERGFAPCTPEELITARARARLQREAERREGGPGSDRGGPGGGAAGSARAGGGTVGACAVDALGHVAAATSTGGIAYKRAGRIGDTPLPGCGTYADDLGGAASATGHGESIIRALVTARCVDRMRVGASPAAAAWACVDQLGFEVGGTGGVICCDPFGRIGAAHSTPYMPTGAGVLRGGQPVVTSLLSVPRDWQPG